MSKLANILFTNELQRRYDEKKIPVTCITIHPGGVLTGTYISFLIPNSLTNHTNKIPLSTNSKPFRYHVL